jgi:hypothetical protein
MMRGIIGMLAFVAAIEAMATEPQIEAEWREPIAHFTAFIADLSAGQLEDAWQKYRIMAPEPPKSPIDPDPYDLFLKSIGQFPRDIESLSHVGERCYSAKSRRLFFVADTRAGPFLLEICAYRYREHWYFGTFSYQALNFADANWHKLHDDLVPIKALDKPIPIELPKAPAPMAN